MSNSQDAQSGTQTFETVLVERNTSEQFAVLTLNRPDKRNALNPQMIEDLRGALNSLVADRQITVVLLQGAGSAFCAGADLASIQDMQSSDYHANLADSRALRDLFFQLVEYPKPTIAVVRGPALAGGAGLATCCDFVLADEEASFGYPEVKIGFVAAMVMVLLTRQVGERTARDLLLTGRRASAAEALQLGLINSVHSAAELDNAVTVLISRLIQNSPQAMAVSKHLLSQVWSQHLEAALDSAASQNARIRGMDDCLEGIAAFLEKRRPKWSGHVDVTTGKA